MVITILEKNHSSSLAAGGVDDFEGVSPPKADITAAVDEVEGSI